MRDQANKNRANVEFKEGDLVYLKLKPYRQQSLARRRYEKLAARFYGPYKILQRLGKVAYKLVLPPTTTIHPVFHVSLLRSAYDIPSNPTQLPPQLNAEMELVVRPASIKGVRKKRGNSHDKLEGTKVLV